MSWIDTKASARTAWQGFVALAHNGLAALGLAAVLFLALDGARLLATPAAANPLAEAQQESVTAAEDETALATRHDPRAKLLASHLARKYRVAAGAIEALVGEAFTAGANTGLDPLLIIAVISIESRFNPIAESAAGARGLMQVIPRFHAAKLAVHGGEKSALDPQTNIRIGAQVLKEYIQRMGSVTAGLQMYAGALEDPNGAYAQRVMTEKQWLQRLVPDMKKSLGTSV